MKLTALSLLALSASAVTARFIEEHEKVHDQITINNVEQERFLIELAPGKTQWVTEEDKWELRRVGVASLMVCDRSSSLNRMAKTSWTSPRHETWERCAQTPRLPSRSFLRARCYRRISCQ